MDVERGSEEWVTEDLRLKAVSWHHVSAPYRRVQCFVLIQAFTIFFFCFWRYQHGSMLTTWTVFGYIFGKFVIKKQQRSITHVKKSYNTYFGVKVEEQDKSWASRKVFVYLWTKHTKKIFGFHIPVIWGKPTQKKTEKKKTPGTRNVQKHSVVNPKKGLFPSLHIQFCLMK